MSRVEGARDEGYVLDRDHPSIELACDRAREVARDRAPPPLAAAVERAIAAHFPSASVRAPSPGVPAVGVRAWRAPGYDPQALDALLAEHATRGALRVALVLDEREGASDAAVQILTRAQAYLDRRNAASEGARFDRALDAHFALHDLDRELVRADYAHALDAWQWVLRLDPEAGLAVQLAALFHDVERLVSEPVVRIEQHAEDYASFKRAHARRGAELVTEALARIDLDPGTVRRVAELVATHEGDGASEDARLLNDADALSFFSRNSAGFADYYGAAHTRTKVQYTLARMSERASAALATVRLRGDVAAMLVEAEATAAGSSPRRSPRLERR